MHESIPPSPSASSPEVASQKPKPKPSGFQKLAATIIITVSAVFLLITGTTLLAFTQWLVPHITYADTYEHEPWYTLNARNWVSPNLDALHGSQHKILALQGNHPIRTAFLLGSWHEMQFQHEAAALQYRKALNLIEASPFEALNYQYIKQDIQESLLKIDYTRGGGKKWVKQLQESPSWVSSRLSKSIAQVLLYPDRADFRMQLAQAFHEDLYLNEAKHEYEMALTLSQDPQLKNEAEQALRLKFPKNLAHLSTDVLTMLKLADAQENVQNDTEKALDTYKEVVKAAPNFEWGWFHLAQAYKKLDKPGKAIEYAQRALKLNSQYALPYLLMGEMAMDQENYAESVGYYEKALSLTQNFVHYEDRSVTANVENQIGYALEQLGKLDAANKHYKSAMSLLEERFKLSLMTQAAAEDWEDFEMDSALEDFRSEDPDYQYAQEALKRIEEEKAKVAKAAAQVTQAS